MEDKIYILYTLDEFIEAIKNGSLREEDGIGFLGDEYFETQLEAVFDVEYLETFKDIDDGCCSHVYWYS